MKRRQWVFCLADLHSTAASDGLMISAPCVTPLVPTKRLVIVIILDKLAFANKEADFLIWSLKGRGSADDQVMKYFYVAASLVSLLRLWRRGDRVETETRNIQRGGHGDVVNIIGLIIRGVSVMRYSKHNAKCLEETGQSQICHCVTPVVAWHHEENKAVSPVYPGAGSITYSIAIHQHSTLQ